MKSSELRQKQLEKIKKASVKYQPPTTLKFKEMVERRRKAQEMKALEEEQARF